MRACAVISANKVKGEAREGSLGWAGIHNSPKHIDSHLRGSDENRANSVILAKAGIHLLLEHLDSRLRESDEKLKNQGFPSKKSQTRFLPSLEMTNPVEGAVQ